MLNCTPHHQRYHRLRRQAGTAQTYIPLHRGDASIAFQLWCVKMAPTNYRYTGPVNNGRGRQQHRRANTNAGVNRSWSNRRRTDSYRPRGTHRRPGRSQRSQGPAEGVPNGPRASLASRITADGSRDDVASAHGDNNSSHPQRRRAVQDLSTIDEINAVAPGRHTGLGGLNRQVTHEALAQVMAATAKKIENDGMDDIDKLLFAPPHATNPENFCQGSAIFCGSQSTQQAAELPLPPSPTSPLLPPSTFYPPLRSVRPATSQRAIRMFSAPVGATPEVEHEAEAKSPPAPKRPANTYRGKDPIKQICQNKKVQRILSGMTPLAPRKKFHLERPDLKIAVSKIMK